MIILLVSILMGFLVAMIAFRRALRDAIERWVQSSDEKLSFDRCVCGYPLRQLDAARCPECGRVIGFDATAEQLGLSTEQLQRVQAKRRVHSTS